MTTLLIFILGFNFGAADTIPNADKIKLIDKILSANHFTLVIGNNGCFTGSEDTYDFNNNKKTIEHSTRFLRPKGESKLISKVIFLPDDLSMLRKAFKAGIIRDNKGQCTSRSYYKISDGTNEVEFEDSTCKYDGLANWRQTINKRDKK